MELGTREVVQMASLVATLAAAYAVVKSQLQRVIEDLIKLTRDVADSEHRIDKTDSEVSVLQMQTKVLAEISSPSELEKRNREIARVQAQIETLQQRVEHLSHIHDGTHPPPKL
jgi:chromosome segregation ATPase